MLTILPLFSSPPLPNPLPPSYFFPSTIGSPKFKLFLHTKLANPQYPPEIQAECTLINFMVTESGLEDQLLAKVVLKERPDLEEEKTFLIVQQNEFKIKLAELEAGLLKQLAEAEGDLTENIVLIESLEEAKRVSIDVNEKVAIAQETEIKINEAREEHREAANRGALLFFGLGVPRASSVRRPEHITKRLAFITSILQLQGTSLPTQHLETLWKTTWKSCKKGDRSTLPRV